MMLKIYILIVISWSSFAIGESMTDYGTEHPLSCEKQMTISSFELCELSKVDLSACSTEEITIDLNRNCATKILDFADNLLKSDALIIMNAPTVMLLLLNSNEIHYLSRDNNFGAMTKLEVIELRDNNMKSIAANTFEENKYLKFIDLQNNKLKKIRFNFHEDLQYSNLIIQIAFNPLLECSSLDPPDMFKYYSYKKVNYGDNRQGLSCIVPTHIKIVYYLVLPICMLVVVLITMYVRHALKDIDKPPAVLKRPKETYVGGKYVDIVLKKGRKSPAKGSEEKPGIDVPAAPTIRTTAGELYLTLPEVNSSEKPNI